MGKKYLIIALSTMLLSCATQDKKQIITSLEPKIIPETTQSIEIDNKELKNPYFNKELMNSYIDKITNSISNEEANELINEYPQKKYGLEKVSKEQFCTGVDELHKGLSNRLGSPMKIYTSRKEKPGYGELFEMKVHCVR